MRTASVLDDFRLIDVSRNTFDLSLMLESKIKPKRLSNDDQNACENASFFNIGFSSISAPFWQELGFQMEAKIDQRLGN